MQIKFESHHALVGGGSKGIGRAVAHSLAQAGAKVTVMARSAEELQAVVNELPGEGHAAIAVDVTDRASLMTQLKKRAAEAGGFDILICNTGGPKAGPIAEAATEDFESAFHNHVVVNSEMAQFCLPHMRDRQFGRIVNIISTSVKVPIPNLGVSNTIRGAVASWSKTLANEVAAGGFTGSSLFDY